MASEQPAGWSKRPSSSAAAASEEAGKRAPPVLGSVRRASKRRENKAGGLFQHPASVSWGISLKVGVGL